MTDSLPSTSLPLSSVEDSPADLSDFGRLGNWLLSFRDEDRDLLKHSREFRDFIDAAGRLEKAQQQIKRWNANEDVSKAIGHSVEPKRSILQYVVSHEALLCVFDFLESHTLVQVSTTCTRLRELAYQNAKSRCEDFERHRQLTNVMQILRAKEQLDGLDSESSVVPEVDLATLSSVRIPTLLLDGRVVVTRAGDPDYNGVYFCTGCNGNGYVFTKPLFQRIPERGRNQDREVSRASQVLKCTFAKCFSGQVCITMCSQNFLYIQVICMFSPIVNDDLFADSSMVLV